MKIIKHGTVIFREGAVAEISGFEIKEGNQDDLRDYVLENYVFKGTIDDEAEEVEF